MTKVRKTLIAVLGVVCAIALSFGVYELLKTPGVSAFAEEATTYSSAADYAKCPTCSGVTKSAVSKTRTCEEDGEHYFYCTVCGWSEWVVLDEDVAIGHQYSEGTQHGECRCVEDCWTEYECAVCGMSFMDETSYQEYTGHTYVSAEVPATCTEDGLITYTCDCEYCISQGGVYEYETIPATGHTPDEGAVTDPTCIEQGYTEHWCTVCSEYLGKSDIVAATGHVWEEVLVAPTETEDGMRYDVCAKCGTRIMQEIIDKSYWEDYAHDYILVDTVYPTCQHGGYYCYECTLEGHESEDYYYEQYADTLSHYETMYVGNTVSADCMTDGYTVYVCPYCSTSVSIPGDSAYGHDYSLKNMSISESRSTLSLSYACTRCGDDLTDYIEADFVNLSTSVATTFYFEGTNTINFSSLSAGDYSVYIYYRERVNGALVTNTRLRTMSVTVAETSSSEEGGSSSSEAETETSFDCWTDLDAMKVYVSYTVNGTDVTSSCSIYVYDDGSFARFVNVTNGAIDLSSYTFAGDIHVIVYGPDGAEVGSTVITEEERTGESSSDTGSTGDTGTSPDTGSSDIPSTGSDDEGSDTGSSDVPSTGTDTETDPDISGDEEAPSGDVEGDDENIDTDTEGSGAGTTDTGSASTGNASSDEESSSNTALIVIIVVIVVLVVALIVYFVLAKMGFFKKKKNDDKGNDNSDDAEDDDKFNDGGENEEENDDEEDYE